MASTKNQTMEQYVAESNARRERGLDADGFSFFISRPREECLVLVMPTPRPAP